MILALTFANLPLIKMHQVVNMGEFNARITPSTTTHPDLYPDDRGDGTTGYYFIIIASMKYEHLQCLTTAIHDYTWDDIEEDLESDSDDIIHYNILPLGVDFSSGDVSYSYVSEEQLWDFIYELDEHTDADDRIMMLWIGHGYYDSENDYGALALYNAWKDSNNVLHGDYIDTYELAEIFRILGPALDFVWIMSCLSEWILNSTMRKNGEILSPIGELSRDGAVAYVYRDVIAYFNGATATPLDSQIGMFINNVLEGRPSELIGKILHDNAVQGNILCAYDRYLGRDKLLHPSEEPFVYNGDDLRWFEEKGFIDNSFYPSLPGSFPGGIVVLPC